MVTACADALGGGQVGVVLVLGLGRPGALGENGVTCFFLGAHETQTADAGRGNGRAMISRKDAKAQRSGVFNH